MRTATLMLCLASAVLGARIEQVAGGGQLPLVEPFGVDFGRNGVWYICEYQGQRITAVDRSGKTSVYAGTGKQGYSGDGGPATAAALRDPHGIVVSEDGQMFVADTLNHVVRRVDPKTGVITTVAGTGDKGFSGDGGPATKATFNGTFGIALDKAGRNLYIADLFNRRVRKIDVRSGIITTIAGNGQEGNPKDGSDAASSPLVDPRAVAVDSKGDVYILERKANALRVVGTDGKIRTLIAAGTVKPDMNGPKHLCVDREDNVIIADAENHLVRRYDVKSGRLTTIVGTGEKGSHIDAANPLATQLNRPHGVTVDPSGVLYISDSYNHRILRVSGL